MINDKYLNSETDSVIKYIPNFILPVNKAGKNNSHNAIEFNLKSLMKSYNKKENPSIKNNDIRINKISKLLRKVLDTKIKQVSEGNKCSLFYELNNKYKVSGELKGKEKYIDELYENINNRSLSMADYNLNTNNFQDNSNAHNKNHFDVYSSNNKTFKNKKFPTLEKLEVPHKGNFHKKLAAYKDRCPNINLISDNVYNSNNFNINNEMNIDYPSNWRSSRGHGYDSKEKNNFFSNKHDLQLRTQTNFSKSNNINDNNTTLRTSRNNCPNNFTFFTNNNYGNNKEKQLDAELEIKLDSGNSDSEETKIKDNHSKSVFNKVKNNQGTEQDDLSQSDTLNYKSQIKNDFEDIIQKIKILKNSKSRYNAETTLNFNTNDIKENILISSPFTEKKGQTDEKIEASICNIKEVNKIDFLSLKKHVILPEKVHREIYNVSKNHDVVYNNNNIMNNMNSRTSEILEGKNLLNAKINSINMNNITSDDDILNKKDIYSNLGKNDNNINNTVLTINSSNILYKTDSTFFQYFNKIKSEYYDRDKVKASNLLLAPSQNQQKIEDINNNNLGNDKIKKEKDTNLNNVNTGNKSFPNIESPIRRLFKDLLKKNKSFSLDKDKDIELSQGNISQVIDNHTRYNRNHNIIHLNNYSRPQEIDMIQQNNIVNIKKNNPKNDPLSKANKSNYNETNNTNALKPSKEKNADDHDYLKEIYNAVSKINKLFDNEKLFSEETSIKPQGSLIEKPKAINHSNNHHNKYTNEVVIQQNIGSSGLNIINKNQFGNKPENKDFFNNNVKQELKPTTSDSHKKPFYQQGSFEPYRDAENQRSRNGNIKEISVNNVNSFDISNDQKYKKTNPYDNSMISLVDNICKNNNSKINSFDSKSIININNKNNNANKSFEKNIKLEPENSEKVQTIKNPIKRMKTQSYDITKLQNLMNLNKINNEIFLDNDDINNILSITNHENLESDFMMKSKLLRNINRIDNNNYNFNNMNNNLESFTENNSLIETRSNIYSQGDSKFNTFKKDMFKESNINFKYSANNFPTKNFTNFQASEKITIPNSSNANNNQTLFQNPNFLNIIFNKDNKSNLSISNPAEKLGANFPTNADNFFRRHKSLNENNFRYDNILNTSKEENAEAGKSNSKQPKGKINYFINQGNKFLIKSKSTKVLLNNINSNYNNNINNKNIKDKVQDQIKNYYHSNKEEFYPQKMENLKFNDNNSSFMTNHDDTKNKIVNFKEQDLSLSHKVNRVDPNPKQENEHDVGKLGIEKFNKLDTEQLNAVEKVLLNNIDKQNEAEFDTIIDNRDENKIKKTLCLTKKNANPPNNAFIFSTVGVYNTTSLQNPEVNIEKLLISPNHDIKEIQPNINNYLDLHKINHSIESPQKTAQYLANLNFKFNFKKDELNNQILILWKSNFLTRADISPKDKNALNQINENNSNSITDKMANNEQEINTTNNRNSKIKEVKEEKDSILKPKPHFKEEVINNNNNNNSDCHFKNEYINNNLHLAIYNSHNQPQIQEKKIMQNNNCDNNTLFKNSPNFKKTVTGENVNLKIIQKVKALDDEKNKYDFKTANIKPINNILNSIGEDKRTSKQNNFGNSIPAEKSKEKNDDRKTNFKKLKCTNKSNNYSKSQQIKFIHYHKKYANVNYSSKLNMISTANKNINGRGKLISEDHFCANKETHKNKFARSSNAGFHLRKKSSENISEIFNINHIDKNNTCKYKTDNNKHVSREDHKKIINYKSKENLSLPHETNKGKIDINSLTKLNDHEKEILTVIFANQEILKILQRKILEIKAQKENNMHNKHHDCNNDLNKEKNQLLKNAIFDKIEVDLTKDLTREKIEYFKENFSYLLNAYSAFLEFPQSKQGVDLNNSIKVINDDSDCIPYELINTVPFCDDDLGISTLVSNKRISNLYCNIESNNKVDDDSILNNEIDKDYTIYCLRESLEEKQLKVNFQQKENIEKSHFSLSSPYNNIEVNKKFDFDEFKINNYCQYENKNSDKNKNINIIKNPKYCFKKSIERSLTPAKTYADFNITTLRNELRNESISVPKLSKTFMVAAESNNGKLENLDEFIRGSEKNIILEIKNKINLREKKSYKDENNQAGVLINNNFSSYQKKSSLMQNSNLVILKNTNYINNENENIMDNVSIKNNFENSMNRCVKQKNNNYYEGTDTANVNFIKISDLKNKLKVIDYNDYNTNSINNSKSKSNSRSKGRETQSKNISNHDQKPENNYLSSMGALEQRNNIVLNDNTDIFSKTWNFKNNNNYYYPNSDDQKEIHHVFYHKNYNHNEAINDKVNVDVNFSDMENIEILENANKNHGFEKSPNKMNMPCLNYRSDVKINEISKIYGNEYSNNNLKVNLPAEGDEYLEYNPYLPMSEDIRINNNKNVRQSNFTHENFYKNNNYKLFLENEAEQEDEIYNKNHFKQTQIQSSRAKYSVIDILTKEARERALLKSESDRILGLQVNNKLNIMKNIKPSQKKSQTVQTIMTSSYPCFILNEYHTFTSQKKNFNFGNIKSKNE